MNVVSYSISTINMRNDKICHFPEYTADSFFQNGDIQDVNLG
jgi:hypothetical protein